MVLFYKLILQMGLFSNLFLRGAVFLRKPHAWRHHHWRFRVGADTRPWRHQQHQRLAFMLTWRIEEGASQTGVLGAAETHRVQCYSRKLQLQQETGAGSAIGGCGLRTGGRCHHEERFAPLYSVLIHCIATRSPQPSTFFNLASFASFVSAACNFLVSLF